MVKGMEITKVSIRDRLIADLKVIMSNPRDYDFSPREILMAIFLVSRMKMMILQEPHLNWTLK